MQARRTSLNVHLPWGLTARILGLDRRDSALPAHGRCPLCQAGRFRVDRDPVQGGAWFSCPDCARAGDLVELAAAVWGISVPGALRMLAKRGVPVPAEALEQEALDDYERDYPRYQARLNALWQRAQVYLADCGSCRCSFPLNYLRYKLRLMTQHSRQAWLQGPGQLLGGLPHADIEACFCPESTGQGGDPFAQRYRLNPSRGRVFVGRGWSDVLVIPYYDLPGRISAFGFLGRKGERADWVFCGQRVLARSGSNQYIRQPPRR